MNKFIEVAKNRNSHTFDELENNMEEAFVVLNTHHDFTTHQQARTAYQALYAAYAYRCNGDDYWDERCEEHISRYKKQEDNKLK